MPKPHLMLWSGDSSSVVRTHQPWRTLKLLTASWGSVGGAELTSWSPSPALFGCVGGTEGGLHTQPAS